MPSAYLGHLDKTGFSGKSYGDVAQYAVILKRERDMCLNRIDKIREWQAENTQNWAGVIMERDYKKEYREYHGKPEQIANRAARNKARREMEKKVGKQALKGKEVDHIKPLSKGGSNSASNLQILPAMLNRMKGNKY